ncbi:hypothetical protein GBBBJNDB_00353 [Pseudomonas phage Callisto]|nr:hypothetical protein GBBBJNDB_00353 [Pseudomonas phage Callisto]
MAKVYQASDSTGEWQCVVILPDVDSALLYATKRCAQMGKVEVVGPWAPVMPQHYANMPKGDGAEVQWRLIPPGCGVAWYVTSVNDK